MSKEITEKQIMRRRTGFDLAPATFSDAQQICKMLAGSGVVPQSYAGRPRDIFVAISMGLEIGLKPLQALQGIAVINGRPTIWGDALIGLVRRHPDCVSIQETFDVETQTATCTATRRGQPPHTQTFSAAEAKAAGLLGKKGPWSQYPRRMLQMRARSWCLRDLFPDALKGLSSAEEIIDVTPVGPVSYDSDDTGGDLVSRLAEQAQTVTTTQEDADDVETESDPADGGADAEAETEESRPDESDAAEIMDPDAAEVVSADEGAEATDPAGQATPADPDRLVHAEILQAIDACETQEQLSHIKPLIERTDEPERIAELRRACRERAKRIAAGDGG